MFTIALGRGKCLIFKTSRRNGYYRYRHNSRGASRHRRRRGFRDSSETRRLPAQERARRDRRNERRRCRPVPDRTGHTHHAGDALQSRLQKYDPLQEVRPPDGIFPAGAARLD